jgi:uncharacterized integral membrane protein (TIGR00697 family)
MTVHSESSASPKALPLLSGLFVAALLIANTLSVKVMDVGWLLLPAGIVVYPLVSVLGDVITEVYGYRATRRIIWTGFLALALQNVAFFIARSAPPAAFWPHEVAFDTILAQAPRIAFASFASYPVGEFVNAYVLARLKARQSSPRMAGRFVVSTMIGQASDSLIFITLAFAGTMPLPDFLTLMVTSWATKVVWEASALPLSTWAAARAKRFEGFEIIDRKIDFSPLKLSE